MFFSECVIRQGANGRLHFNVVARSMSDRDDLKRAVKGLAIFSVDISEEPEVRHQKAGADACRVQFSTGVSLEVALRDLQDFPLRLPSYAVRPNPFDAILPNGERVSYPNIEDAVIAAVGGKALAL